MYNNLSKSRGGGAFVFEVGYHTNPGGTHLEKWYGDVRSLRGYCTPGQFLDCFCIFLKNYNTLVTSKICFL